MRSLNGGKLIKLMALPACVAICLMTGLGACSAPPASRSGKACFPAEAARWIEATDTARRSAPASAAGATKATLYIDRSGSMAGYLSGATPFERPFQDLIESLPAALTTMGQSAEYRAFGAQVSAPLPDGRTRLQRADFYTCQGSGCDNQDSRLDAVLDEVTRRPGEFALLVTDLWFRNPDLQSSGLTALQPRLAGLLAAGKTIAIYGMDAPYAGRIYDLPASASLPYTGRHPLYLIAIGTKADMAGFDAALSGSGSRFIAEGMSNGRIKKAIFMLDPAAHTGISPVQTTANPRLISDRFEPQDGVDIPSYRLVRHGAPAPTGSAMWTGPDPDRLIPGAVWQAPLSAQTRIWRRVKSHSCADGAWVELGRTTEGWRDQGDGRKSLRLDQPALLNRLATPGVYLVSAQLEPQASAGPASPAAASGDGWMRGNWNLRPEDAASVAAAPPDLFPTLNLSEFARLLSQSLSVAAAQKGAPLDGFTILIEVEP